MGIPLKKEFGRGKTDDTPSIDRIDCTKGYIKGNVRIVSWWANRLKSNLTLEQIEALYKYIKE